MPREISNFSKLDKFNWLSYSEKLEGVFCKYCLVFAKFGGKRSQALGSLVTFTFQN
jgi:hypothetical protein